MNPLHPQDLLQSSTDELRVDLIFHKGFWYDPMHLERLLLSQDNFQAADTDVVQVTSFKSGTTWLKALLFAVTKRSQCGMDDPNHRLLSSNPHELVPFLEVINTEPYNATPPRLLSTHSPYNMLPESVKTSRCRIIYLARDPKDVFVSMWNFTKATKLLSGGCEDSSPLEEAFEQFCKGHTTAGPIWDHALEYWNMSLKGPEKILFLKYKDLKCDIISQVKKMAEFVGFPFSAEEESKGVVEDIAKMCSFNHLSNLEVNKSGVLGLGSAEKGPFVTVQNKYFFRKGEVGDWKNYITPSMTERLDQVIEQKLLGSGLKFD